jgi:hypothetical protein
VAAATPGGGGEDDGIPAVEVLEANWETVQVFTRCEPTLVIGATAARFMGIAAAEVQAVMAVLGIPRARRLGVFDAVKQMGVVWSQVKNES